MEENSRPESPPALPDLAATEGCRNELTRTNSDSSSVTLESSKDFIRQNTNTRPCVAWTDEKHNSYLDALEASFIKQLHHSLGLLSWRSEQNMFDSNPSRQLPVNAGCSSEQFTVLRDGSWQNINFERSQPLLYRVAGSHVVTESPWIRHFTRSGKRSTIPSADLRECSIFPIEEMPLRGKRIFTHRLTSSEQQCLCHHCHQDAVGTIAEVSDQNFLDEDQEERSSSLSGAKRLKMDAADASTKDQIVPSGNVLMEEISTAWNPSSEREEEVHHKCPPQNFESYICSKHAVKSFLTES